MSARVKVGIWAVVVAAAFVVVQRADKWERLGAEAQARNNLAGMRAEVAKALAANQPLDTLADMPLLWLTHLSPMVHHADNQLKLVVDRPPVDYGYWVYDHNSRHLYIDCTHTDSRGTVWTAY